MPASLVTPRLPSHATPDHVSWPLGHMCHIGAFRGPGGWEVAYHGPGVWTSLAVYGQKKNRAVNVASTLYLHWDVLRHIPTAHMRAMLEFFQPQAAA